MAQIKAPTQKTLIEKSTKEPIIEIPDDDSWINFIASGKSNANSVISPSKFPEGNYSFVKMAETDVDYKDKGRENENGEEKAELTHVSYMLVKDIHSNALLKLKVTPTLALVLEDLPFDIRVTPFHYFAKAITTYNVKISITIYEPEK